MNSTRDYLDKAAEVAHSLDADGVDRLVEALAALRDRGGRLFLLGVGGSAANCSHAAADFRKVTGIQAYTPADNVAELTARINDEGWDSSFVGWLDSSGANAHDAILVFSVGGGDAERGISSNLVCALQEARRRSMRIFGIVGRDGGFTKRVGDCVVVVPSVDARYVTALTEAFQAVVWHGLICHPRLQRRSLKWEAVSSGS